MAGTDQVWQQPQIVARYLSGVRGAIPFASEQLRLIVTILQSCEKPIHRVLDLGCGDGALAGSILQHFPAAEVTLVDFSEPMLEGAKRRWRRSARRVKIVSADYSLPGWTRSVGHSFDAVVSGFSIHHQNDAAKRRIYRDTFGLLSPGGIFLNLEHVSSTTPWVEALHDESFVNALYQFERGNGSIKTLAIVRSEYDQRADKAANILASVEAQCRWLRRLGFEDVACFFKYFELALFGGRKPKLGNRADYRRPGFQPSPNFSENTTRSIFRRPGNTRFEFFALPIASSATTSAS